MFAKLYERNGEQVLVTKDSNEEGKPTLNFSMEFGEIRAAPKYTFPDSDEGLERRDVAFDACTEDQAFRLRESLAKDCGIDS